MSYIIEERTETTYDRFNMGLYIDYRREKPTVHQRDLSVKHPLLGAYFSHTNEDGVTRVVRVDRASKLWWAGYYIMAVYVDESGVCGTITIENINSICPSTIENHERFCREFVQI